MIFRFVARLQMLMRTPLFEWQTCTFCLKLPQGLYYMSANSKGSGEAAPMLAWFNAGCQCDNYPFPMCRLISFYCFFWKEWIHWVDFPPILTTETTLNSAFRYNNPHYENTPIQIYWKFYNQKEGTFSNKKSDIFHIPAQNIDCGYSLEPPRRGASNEYPRSMFF